jgi:hypothetical protein
MDRRVRRALVTSGVLGVLAAFGVLVAGCGLDLIGDAAGSGASPATDGGTATDGADGSTPSGDTDASATPTVHAQTALSFVATSNQYMNVPTIPIPADFTLEAWVNPAKLGAEMMIASEDRSPLQLDNQFRLALTSSGAPYFVMTDTGSDAHGLATDTQAGPFALSGAAIPTGRWTHLAVTKSGANFTLFVNGAVVTAAQANSATFSHNATFNFRVGARMGNGGPANYFDGVIDEVRLFDVGRSAAEIAGDMSTELAAAAPARKSLVAYFRFDEGSGTTAKDDVGLHDGTLLNGVSWVTSTAF